MNSSQKCFAEILLLKFSVIIRCLQFTFVLVIDITANSELSAGVDYVDYLIISERASESPAVFEYELLDWSFLLNVKPTTHFLPDLLPIPSSCFNSFTSALPQVVNFLLGLLKR